ERVHVGVEDRAQGRAHRRHDHRPAPVAIAPDCVAGSRGRSHTGPRMTADDDDPDLPFEPIDRIIGPLERFLHVQAASGIVLVLATATALVLANSSAAPGFLEFWNTRISF